MKIVQRSSMPAIALGCFFLVSACGGTTTTVESPEAATVDEDVPEAKLEAAEAQAEADAAAAEAEVEEAEAEAEAYDEMD